MSICNVIRGLDDPFYRYTMERLQTKIEGNGNGIKTVLVNMSKIGKALNRPAAYPTKFFGCELGAQTQFDEKHGRYIVNGSHDTVKLTSLLDEFIKKFVLCISCSNPETDILIDKNQYIYLVCKACGQRTRVDMRHKLTTFILNNPPPGVVLRSGNKKEKRNKDERRKTKRTGAGGTESTGNKGHDHRSSPENMSPNDEEEDNDLEEPDVEAPPMRFEEEDDWGEDPGEKCERAMNAEEVEHLQKVDEQLEKLTLANDLDKSTERKPSKSSHPLPHAAGASEDDLEDPMDALLMYLQQHPLPTYEEITQEILRLAFPRRDKVMLVLSHALFDSNEIIAEIGRHRSFFLRQIASSGDIEKAQRATLGGVEMVIAKRPGLLARVPLVFKALYDFDLVSEDIFLAWDKKVSKKFVEKDMAKQLHQKAKPFLTWLENAQEESSEDDQASHRTPTSANVSCLTSPVAGRTTA